MIGNQFLVKSGFQLKPLALLNGYPLDTSSPETFETSLAENVQQQTLRLQLYLYHRKIDDSVKIDEWWLTPENNKDIVKRISENVATAFNEKKILKLDKDSSELLKNLRYFSENPGIVKAIVNVTTWIITDFESTSNRLFTIKALKSIATQKNNKVALISNPKDSKKPCSFNLDEAFSLNELIEVLEREDSELDYCSSTKIPKEFLEKYGGKPGDTAVISNGLIIGVKDDFEIEDFEYLDKLWKEKGAGKATEYLNKKFKEDVSVNFYSTLSRTHQKDRTKIRFDDFKSADETNLMVFPPKNPNSPALTITWIANPITREAQHLISIVKLLGRVLNSKIEIIFNPPFEISEMPIKRFYRFVGSEELEFDESGAVKNHVATFSNLPQKQLLTMSMETIDSWMIEVKQAEYDLDNILLETIIGDVEAVFSLEHILVEGQSHTESGEASVGMELELKSKNAQYDTIVMKNLGYFQLKAEPGIWNLRLRNGTSSQHYRILEVDSKNIKKDARIVVDSFTGKWTELTVEKLDRNDDESSIEKLMRSAKGYFTTPESTESINVFSLASGHLYERFMRIMMVSVMKNTKSKNVKFWLLKNYLSPKFKETIPILAEFYGFEYELVEYKWPKWLHQQTEKQRVMWGYKILFLDVLFPLNVDKIIFVDADQVVRSDLLELMNFNLNGAPYGYVPFCENRKEMDGFRFWKTGYWESHLMGRRYHISALYVVDLKTFRKVYAGDRLRGRYDSLSSDPNSLSNLDQDLPNNMIHEVAIKSLPQDWLWCETWCDDKSKKTAKTIDLCNNPLTKEPKLNAAQRIIGEWKDLDEEIAEVIRNDGHIENPVVTEEKKMGGREEKDEL
ncbi:hypothetical protein CAEBREN_31603 [Caenorhabditis brenneri]|uniref:Uncharacterized protein n=1 Tax=Caenorhabditis brenneri TaxID=135651 RepID=G0MLX6_CAEBE|nr:hypothetical protein CAEBREN_31603 [Caenorhabditis brenneri]